MVLAIFRHQAEYLLRVPDEQMARIVQIAGQLGLKKLDVTKIAINEFVENFRCGGDETKPYNRVKHLLGVVWKVGLLISGSGTENI